MWFKLCVRQSHTYMNTHIHTYSEATDSPYPASKREKEYLIERQELAIEFIFCLVLIEVLAKVQLTTSSRSPCQGTTHC